MKSLFSKAQFFVILLVIVAVITACTPATPFPTFIPFSTSTPLPTSTFTPSPTPTETPTPPPTPVQVSVIKNTILYSGPSKDGYEKISSLTAGTTVELLGKFEDFMLVRLYGNDHLQEGYIPSVMLSEVPSDFPTLTIEQVPWKVLKSIATEEKPFEQENNHDNWQSVRLIRGLKFSNALEMKLNMVSMGANSIILTYTEGGGEPWWKGTKRMEIFCAEGTLGVFLRDGTAEEVTFTNSDNIPMMQTSDGATICQFSLKFDQYAKNVQILQDNVLIFLFTPEQVGNFQGGLFPDGKILKVELYTSPKSSGSPSSVKLSELVFYVPPDGKY